MPHQNVCRSLGGRCGVHVDAIVVRVAMRIDYPLLEPTTLGAGGPCCLVREGVLPKVTNALGSM